MSRWRRLRELGWSDTGFLLFASAALLGVGLLVATAGFRRSIAWLRRTSGAGGSREVTAESLAWARRRADLIAIAARFGPYRATCLRRSLLLWWWTRRRGLDPRLCVGVRREDPGSESPKGDPNGAALRAHAWIELAGEVLDDRPEVVSAYAEFDAENLPARVSWS